MQPFILTTTKQHDEIQRDEIIVPSHTAFPTMEPLIHMGARPVFVDVDDTYVMDLEQVEAAITPRTRAVLINSPSNPSGRLWA